MNDALHTFVSLDLVPLFAATAAAVMCALLGNFLLLRKQCLMGDAISHSVLPGLVIAFLITNSRSPSAMFLGAAAAGIATVILVELIKRFGRVESSAAMGVTFSILFALGVLLIEQAAARQVDLDADCVLHGQVETLAWIGAPQSLEAYFDLSTYRGTFNAATGIYENGIPVQAITLAAMLIFSAAFIALCFKELRIVAFDPGLATTLGFHSGLVHILLMVFVAAATVAAFEAVGSILVIAMLICPAATARLFTDRLHIQIWLSALVGLITGIGGYLAGAFLPHRVGLPFSVNVAGSMTTLAAFMLISAIVLSPSHGVLARSLRRLRLSRQTRLEDLLGLLYRSTEESRATELPREQVTQALDRMHAPHSVLASAQSHGLIRLTESTVALEPAGRRQAASLIRRHRLWEDYLVNAVGVRPDHVHEPAEDFEHLVDLHRTHIAPDIPTARDPHGKSIPDDPDSADASKRND